MKKLLVGLIFLFLTLPLQSAIYYVDASRPNDDGDGLSEGAAWKTLGKVQAELTGDQSDTVVKFKCGEEWRGWYVPAGFGTSGHPFVHTSYGEGADPIIDASTVATGWAPYGAGAGSTYVIYNINPAQGWSRVGMVRVGGTLILTYVADEDTLAEGEYHHDTTDDDLYVRLAGDADPDGFTIEYDEYYASVVATAKDYITIENFMFRGGFDGIRIQDGCDYWIIQDCTTRYNSEKGVKIQGDNLECTYNTIQRIDVRYCGEPSRGLSSYGIQVTSDVGNASSNNLIQNNLIRDTEKGAFSLRHADSNIWRYNESYATGESCVFHDDSDSNEWYYNIFDHDGWNDGDSIFYIFSASLNNEIYNNVIISNGNDVGIKCYGNSTGTKVKNNIYYGAARYISVSDGSHTNFESDYNCLYVTGATFGTWRGVNKTTFTNWKDDSSQDANSTDSNPSFVNKAGDNFKLQSNSPCIETGTDVSLTPDIVGTIVPQGNFPEMGAYEYPFYNILRIRDVLRIRNVLRIK